MNECPDLALFFLGGRTLDPTDVVHPTQAPGTVSKEAVPVSPYPAGSEPGEWTYQSHNTD